MWVQLIIVTQIIVVAFSGYPNFGLRSTRSEHPQNGSGTDTSPEVYIVWPKSTQQQISDDRCHFPAKQFSWNSCNVHSMQGNDNVNCPLSLADFLNHFCADQNESLDIFSNAETHVQRNILLRLQPGEHALNLSKRFICYDNLSIEGSSAASTVISATGTGVGRKLYPFGVITFVRCGKVLIKDITFQLGSTDSYSTFIYDGSCRKFEIFRCIFIDQNPNLVAIIVDAGLFVNVSSSATISDCRFRRLADRPFSLYGHIEPSLRVILFPAPEAENKADISHKVAITGSAFIVRFSASACTSFTREQRHRKM